MRTIHGFIVQKHVQWPVEKNVLEWSLMMTEAEVLNMLRTQYPGVTGPFKTHDGVTYVRREDGRPITLADARELVGDCEDHG